MSNFITLNGFLLNLQKSFLLILVLCFGPKCAVSDMTKNQGDKTHFCSYWVREKSVTLPGWAVFFHLSPRERYVVWGASLLFWIVDATETYPFSSMSNFITLNGFLLNLQKSFLLILVLCFGPKCAVSDMTKNQGDKTHFCSDWLREKNVTFPGWAFFFQLSPRERYVVRGASLLFWIHNSEILHYIWV